MHLGQYDASPRHVPGLHLLRFWAGWLLRKVVQAVDTLPGLGTSAPHSLLHVSKNWIATLFTAVLHLPPSAELVHIFGFVESP
jgi:hypothetical protein